MISVIIATIHEENYLPRLLNDLKNQIYSEFEVIVCDGGSKDKTVEIAKQFGCKVIKSKVSQQQYQQNQAAKKASGEVLLFLDADIKIDSDEFLLKAVEEFHERQLGGASFYSRFESPLIKYKISSKVLNFVTWLGSFTLPVSYGGNGIITRKDLFNRLEGFDEELLVGYDHDYSHRLVKIGEFGVIRSTSTITSKRRFEKEGVVSVWFRWFMFSLQRVFMGKVKTKIVEYDMEGRDRIKESGD